MIRSFLAVAIVAALVPAAQAAPPPPDLPGLVRVERVREHQLALQRIAEAHGGNRASGHPGYAASADYVTRTLAKAGYRTSEQRFDFDYFELTGEQVLAQAAPATKSYQHEVDFYVRSLSTTATVDAGVTLVSLTCGGKLENFPAGTIAMLRMEPLCWREQAAGAAAAGAAAVVFEYPDSTDRASARGEDLRAPQPFPVLSVEASPAKEFRELAAKGLRLRIETRTLRERRSTTNVIAEAPVDLDPENRNVVMVGAHLDGVPAGPGSNDNASGTGAVLAIAEQLARVGPTRNTVRFAFWGAEESGLWGSKHYTAGLTEAERAGIALYLNFDMLGSPNYVRQVQYGEDAGSAAILRAFTGYFAGRGLATEPIQHQGTDHVPFAWKGIPVGGLEAGASELKTAEQAKVYGGTAGQPLDPCYHQACDDYRNVNLVGLDELTDGAAFAVQHFAHSVREVRQPR